jgi:uncharacterized membrane-anchored protein
MAESARSSSMPYVALRFHGDRNSLLAEAHARPSTPLPTPTLASRIATLSDRADNSSDLNHMVALCRRLGVPEPQKGVRWCVLDAGSWWLRWEQHTEASTWTFYRPIPESYIPKSNETALDLVPQDWLTGLPGETLVAAHISLLRERSPMGMLPAADEVATDLSDGAAQVYTDFRTGADSFTHFQLIQAKPDAAQAGRIMLRLFEIETYRLMALLAFPLAGEVAKALSRLEAETIDAAIHLADEGGIEEDRALLRRLATLAGEAQTLAGRTNFRFAAARAYYGIVLERIQQLREQRIGSRPNIADFMERRLAPAMRTCAAVSERQQSLIEHVARTSQLLNTRVELAAEVTNAKLLASMDKRARWQLRLQQTVEGLSVAAISYYGVGLLASVFGAVENKWPNFDKVTATGIAVPVVFALVWWALQRVRKKIRSDDSRDSE